MRAVLADENSTTDPPSITASQVGEPTERRRPVRKWRSRMTISGVWPLLRWPTVLSIHVILTALAYWAAFALRFDFDIPRTEWRLFASTLPYLLVLRLCVLGRMGVFRGSWRHVSLSDLVTLSIAVTLSSLLFVATLFLTGHLLGMPRSVLALDWVLLIFLSGGVRFATRCAREGQLSGRPAKGKRTFLIGAGEAAERFLRQSLHDGRGSMCFVGLLDDDPRTHGVSLHGVPVIGSIEGLGELASRHRVELLVIAIPSATGEQIRRIVGLCAEAGIEFKILPSLQELVDGRAEVGQLRNVQIDDLLGREPIHLDLERVERDLALKTVLVTGGAGSIGSELARQIAGFCPARLVLFEQAESLLYFIHLELCKTYPGLEIIPLIGDITDADRLEFVFATYRPQYIFHAAAYKHVPMMEANVGEAVRNNVLGTLRVVECAARHRAEKFVLISTDKAVNPSSIMGATKRLAEQIVLGWRGPHQSVTDFRAVRFGNVLGSDGSVIPLFKKQLAAGGPLTVTHPDVRRYFMTIPEAVQLVLQASALPEAAGRISMLDMGEPIRILDLAEQLIRLSGLVPYRDVDIVFTGLRPGEKLHEELMSTLESSLPTVVEKIRIVQTDGAASVRLETELRHLLSATASGCRDAVVQELRALVPEYSPSAVHEAEQERPLPQSSEPDVALDRESGRRVALRVARPLSDLGAAGGGIERALPKLARA
jgi:FlaA1/EpsC-like NDP-sugar epimerase